MAKIKLAKKSKYLTVTNVDKDIKQPCCDLLRVGIQNVSGDMKDSLAICDTGKHKLPITLQCHSLYLRRK